MRPPDGLRISDGRLSADGERMEYTVSADLRDVICTGNTATWCPVHGPCTCPELEPTSGGAFDDPEPGERTLTDENCALHGPTSSHGHGLPIEGLQGAIADLEARIAAEPAPPGWTDKEWREAQAIARAGYAYCSHATFRAIKEATTGFDLWTGGRPAASPLLGSVQLIVAPFWPDDVIGTPEHVIRWRRLTTQTP